MKKILLPLTLSFVASAALASGDGSKLKTEQISYLPNGVLSYEVFEATIGHVDLIDCPVAFDGDANFCRMTLANEQAHVFVFSHDGNQPLLAVKSYDLDDGFLPF